MMTISQCIETEQSAAYIFRDSLLNPLYDATLKAREL